MRYDGIGGRPAEVVQPSRSVLVNLFQTAIGDKEIKWFVVTLSLFLFCFIGVLFFNWKIYGGVRPALAAWKGYELEVDRKVINLGPVKRGDNVPITIEITGLSNADNSMLLGFGGNCSIKTSSRMPIFLRRGFPERLNFDFLVPRKSVQPGNAFHFPLHLHTTDPKQATITVLVSGTYN